MEGSTSNNIPIEDEIQPVSNEELYASENDENCQLLLNITIDNIENDLGDSSNNTDSDSYSSNSINLQMSTMEKFKYISTRILYSKYFQYYYFTIVLLSIASLILTCTLECSNNYYILLEGFIILALLIEVTIRLLAQRKYYFYSFWNILDIIILGVCVWLFYITQTECPLSENDSLIDSGILIIRYIIQFIRLCILLRKNKSSGANKKRKSVNFNQLNRKPTYGSFNPSSHHRKVIRKDSKTGEIRVDEEEVDGEGEGEGESGYPNIINSRVFNPYGAIDDSRISIYDNSVQNESFVSVNNLSQSFIRDYANYLQLSQGSIDININSNANLAKVIYREGTHSDFDSKQSLNTSHQNLLKSSIENNHKDSYNRLPPSKNSGDRLLASSTYLTNDIDQSFDSISTNPIETPSTPILSPSFSSYRKKQLPPQPQKTISPEVSFSISLPPKIGKKQNQIAQTNHSSTFNEIPSRVNLLTPILYGNPATYTTRRN